MRQTVTSCLAMGQRKKNCAEDMMNLLRQVEADSGTAKMCRRPKEIQQKKMRSMRLVIGVESGGVDVEAFLCT